MTGIGYTLMTEQAGPKDLIHWAQQAEAVGFDTLVSSDHFFPWLEAQGHAPNAWVTLGAVAQATSTIELMTYVTCPTMRYHPAVVAQQAATLAVLSDNRFVLGLGSGERLNEHVVGEGWPEVGVRQDMFVEALQIIRRLLDGEFLDFEGDYFRVDSAKLWDLPDRPVQLGAAVSGPKSCGRFAPLADLMIAVEPKPELAKMWDESAGRSDSRKVGQMPISWGADAGERTKRAHEQFRWFAGGWSVNADLPTPAGFAGASQFVRPEDVAQTIACGNSVEAVVKGAQGYWDAGFTDLALVQIGGTDAEQQDFFTAAPDLIKALKEAAAG